MWIVLAMYVAIAILTTGAVASSRVEDGSNRSASALDIVSAGASALLGPFQGGFARNWQSCCAENSWSLFPAAALALVLGSLAQFLPLPEGRLWARARLLCWTAGWLFWFGAGIFSLGHALE